MYQRTRMIRKVPAPGVRGQGTGENRKHYDCSNPFPSCKLHGGRLVQTFPSGCPLAAPNPLTALAGMQDAAYAVMHPENERLAEGLAGWDSFHTCSECVRTLIGHPAVRRLRDMLRSAAPPVPLKDAPTEERAAPSKRNGRSAHRGRPRRARYVE